jgi:hypothetical protein
MSITPQVLRSVLKSPLNNDFSLVDLLSFEYHTTGPEICPEKSSQYSDFMYSYTLGHLLFRLEHSDIPKSPQYSDS